MKSVIRRTSLSAIVFFWLLTSYLHGQLPGLDNPSPIGPYLNGVFPAVKPGSSDWSTVNAFTNLVFIDPIWLASYPGTNDLLVVGKQGMLWRFEHRENVTQGEVVTMLDWRAKTQVSEDQGMYSCVTHPEFGQAGSTNRNYIYLCYSHRPNFTNAIPDRTYWRVSRFTVLEGSRIVDTNSELVLINQFDPHRWHQGGAMFFDNDGYLYVSFGDGGAAQGNLGLTQKIDFGIYSGIFRIDVDKKPARSHPIRRQPVSHSSLPAGWPPSATQEYFVPNDNPFVNTNGTVLEEYFALGVRSPHSMKYDPLTGQIWLGDVGDAAREEIDLVAKGANLQWNFKEGFADGFAPQPSNLIGTNTPPVLDWPRSEARTIICGHLYRGSKFADALAGKLLVGDFYYGKIWALTYYTNQPPVLEMLVDDFPHNPGAKLGLANICRDAAGEEVYLMTLNGTDVPGGTIRKLIRSTPTAEPPALLSQTGAFTNLQTMAPASGLVPFTVNSPLWSDRAEKHRWIALPNDGTHNTAAEKIVFNETNNWVFPAGTVFLKHFELPVDARFPVQTVRLETRFIVCTTNGGKYGVTYRWFPNQSDAALLPGADSGSYAVTAIDGSVQPQPWSFPSRGDCLFCHNDAAGQALGVKTFQLNGNAFYPQTGRTANQLATWNALGMFDQTLTSTAISNFMALRSINDPTAPLEHRVRSYLDSNCSHCHRPGGPGLGFDARLITPLRSQGIVNGTVQQFDVLGPDASYIRPGLLNKSAVHYQMLGANGAGMPPLAKNLVDSNAVSAVTAYILGLTAAEFEINSTVSARYVRFTALQEIELGPWTSAAEFEALDPSLVRMPVSAVTADSQEIVAANNAATNAVDGSTATFWHTQYQGATPGYPHWLQLDLGSVKPLGGYRYVPRQGSLTGGENNGRVDDWRVEVSTNGSSWQIIHSVTNFGNTIASFVYTGLTSGRPVRASLAGPAVATTNNFEATLTFDNDVVGLTPSDLVVSNASITALRGSRHYYVLTLQPTGSVVQATLPTNVVADAQGFANRPASWISVVIVDNTPFAFWAATNGLQGPAAGKLADPDGDGLPNMAEYAFNLNPLLANSAPGPLHTPYALLVEKPAGGYALRVVFRRRIQAAADQIQYAVQFTSSVAGQPTWTESNASVLITPVDGEWEQVVIEDAQTSLTASARFARVIARLAP